MAEKRAAIDVEKIMDSPLSQISAADFLTALSHDRVSASYLVHWPEKKKYELLVEPENVGHINLGRLIDILRGEKKKVELEKDPSSEIFRKLQVEDIWEDPRQWREIGSLATRLTGIEARFDALEKAIKSRMG